MLVLLGSQLAMPAARRGANKKFCCAGCRDPDTGQLFKMWPATNTCPNCGEDQPSRRQRREPSPLAGAVSPTQVVSEQDFQRVVHSATRSRQVPPQPARTAAAPPVPRRSQPAAAEEARSAEEEARSAGSADSAGLFDQYEDFGQPSSPDPGLGSGPLRLERVNLTDQREVLQNYRALLPDRVQLVVGNGRGAECYCLPGYKLSRARDGGQHLQLEVRCFTAVCSLLCAHCSSSPHPGCAAGQ